MSADQASARVAQLLNERVAASLSILALVLGWGNVAALALTVLAHLTTVNVDMRFVYVNAACSIALAIAVHRLVRNRRYVNWVGAVLAGLSALFTAQNLLLMYLLFRDNAEAYLVMVKAPGPVAGLLAVSIMGFTLRPLYVAVAGGGAVATLLIALAFVSTDSRTAIAPNGLASLVSPSIDPVWFLFQVLMVAAGAVAIFFATVFARRTVFQAAQLQQSTDNLSRFFSPNVAADIQRRGSDLMEVGGKEQQIVVLFSDLTGFTAGSAGMEAREVLAMLSAYQERMVDAIFREGGTLDKFISDGIMAIFGAPTAQPDAADRAVRAAVGMTAALAALNEERKAAGKPALAQRIGIHAGPAIVGNMGTARRLEFTAIGDTVNIANRIEGACKILRQEILISQSVADLLRGRYKITRQPVVDLKGVTQDIALYAVTG